MLEIQIEELDTKDESFERKIAGMSFRKCFDSEEEGRHRNVDNTKRFKTQVINKEESLLTQHLGNQNER